MDPRNLKIGGFHHISAVTADAELNYRFYAEVLGLRLVKLTVNFDSPTSYHLYYGDNLGHPGTILTFFVIPGSGRGRVGNGEVGSTYCSIPKGTSGFWSDRLKQHKVECKDLPDRFDSKVLCLRDPEGLDIELVERANSIQPEYWNGSSVPQEYAITGFCGVALNEGDFSHTARLLTDTMGFTCTNRAGNLFRFEIGAEGSGTVVDLFYNPDLTVNMIGRGHVHHVAWRTPDDRQHEAWREIIARHGTGVTPIIDRKYFHSIYFREPGGVLFEIATDSPGMTIDESPERLGSELMLPLWLEADRERIERTLPSFSRLRTLQKV